MGGDAPFRVDKALVFWLWFFRDARPTGGLSALFIAAIKAGDGDRRPSFKHQWGDRPRGLGSPNRGDPLRMARHRSGELSPPSAQSVSEDAPG